MSSPVLVATTLFLGNGNGQLQSASGSSVEEINGQVALANINNATSYTRSVCQTNCVQLTQNITVVVSPGAVVGPVTFTQQCEFTDISCVIDNMVGVGVNNTLQTLNKKNSGQITLNVPTANTYGDVTVPVIKSDVPLDSYIKNSVFQMISSACLFESNQTIENNYVYIGTDATTGAVSFVQQSQITTTDCIIDTIAKSSSAGSDVPMQSPDLLILIVVIIVIFLVLAIIIAIAILVARSRSGPANKSKLPGSEIPPQVLAQAQTLVPQVYYTQNVPPAQPISIIHN